MADTKILAERARFELTFPTPSNCVWISNGYSATSYSAWPAHDHIERWNGWWARSQADAAQAQAEPVADERDEEIERLRDLVIRQGTQLERIVNIVRGDPAEGCAHSTHDAADLVYGLKMHSDQYAMAVEHEQRAAQPVRQPLTESQKRNADFLAFAAWAGGAGYDTANTYDTDRSRWVALNPMTADLWACWQAAQPVAVPDWQIDRARAFVPDGWALVPLEPTPEMLGCIVHRKYPEDWDAGKLLQARQRGDGRVPFKTEYEIAVGQYERMLAAAPKGGAV